MTIRLSGTTLKVELTHTSKQKPRYINHTNASRDFGPISTKLSMIHAAILVPGLQLLSSFQKLYHFCIPSYFPKGHPHVVTIHSI